MARRIVWLVLCCLLVIALMLSSCGPAVEEEEEEGKTVVGEVTEKEEEVEEEEVVAEEEEEEEGPQYGGVMTVGGYKDVLRGFDPYRYYVYAQHAIGGTILEGLAIGDWAKGPGGTGEWDFGGFLVPPKYTTGLLAESWEESSDGLTVTFHLRKGIRFHNKPPANGREVTSADVKYCWDRRYGTGSGFTEPTPWNAQPGCEYLEEITTPDKYTVVFQASQFNYQFLQELLVGYEVGIYPPEVIETYGSMDEWQNVCGTGPFMLTDYVPGSQFTQTKNPDYWRYDPLYPENKLPYVDEIKMLIIPDAATRMSAIRTGKIDYTLYKTLEWREKEQLEKTMPYELNFGKVYYGTSIAIKFNMDEPPLDDLKVRRALYMGLDFQEIADIKGGDNKNSKYGSFMNNAFGPDIYTEWEDLPEVCKDFLTYQPEKAKQLLTEAGYPNGFKLELLTTTSYIDIYEMVVDQWKRINVDLGLDIVTSAVKSARDRTGDYQMTTTLPGTVGYTTTIHYVITGTYKTRYDDPYPVEEYNRLTQIVDEAERNAAFKALNIYLLENVFLITPRVKESTYMVTQPWVGGYHGEFMLRKHDPGSVLNYLWINQDVKDSLMR